MKKVKLKRDSAEVERIVGPRLEGTGRPSTTGKVRAVVSGVHGRGPYFKKKWLC